MPAAAVLASASCPVMHGMIPLLIRNGAAANAVTLDSDGWSQELTLAGGEERRVEVPLAPRTSARVRIRSDARFRPSDVDPNSRDTRLLGVFVRLAVGS